MDEVLIMGAAVPEFQDSVRQVITIWVAVVVGGGLVVALVVMAARLVRRRYRTAPPDQPASRPAPAPSGTGGRLPGHRTGRVYRAARPDTADLRRYADELAVAADRAARTAARQRADWLAAQAIREAAWRAYDAADADARRVLRAAAFPLPAAPLTDAELAYRERHLRNTATDAYRQRQLSTTQLGDLLAHRGGWDPQAHPIEQETMLRRAAQHGLLRAYRVAAELERAAWQAAETAAAASRCLTDQAFAAALSARPEPVAPAVGRRHRSLRPVAVGSARPPVAGSVRPPVAVGSARPARPALAA